MSNKQWIKAERLANRQYVTIISREKTEDGDRYYVAMHPDLPGCMADGKTPKEAKEELALARIDFIYFLLEDNLPVPDPKTYEVSLAQEYAKYTDNIPEQSRTIPHSGYVVQGLSPV